MRLVEILRRYCSFCKDFDDFKMISQKTDKLILLFEKKENIANLYK